MALKSMSIEKLRDLKSKVEAAIHTHLVGRRRELESELSKWFGSRAGGAAVRLAGVEREDQLPRNTEIPRTLPRLGLAED